MKTSLILVFCKLILSATYLSVARTVGMVSAEHCCSVLSKTIRKKKYIYDIVADLYHKVWYSFNPFINCFILANVLVDVLINHTTPNSF